MTDRRTHTLALIRQRYRADGGAERFVARALEALDTDTLELTLITRAWQAQGGLRVIKCDPPQLGRVWREWGFARRACRLVRENHFDLVQSHERLACCDIYRAGDGVHAQWLRLRARSLGPIARWAQALSPFHTYMKYAERRLFNSQRLKIVICNSRMIRDEIQQQFAIDENKLKVIYSGVDTQAFHPRLKTHRQALRESLALPQDAPVLLFVGSGFQRKGLPTLLQALRSLAKDTYLIVVGKDKKMGYYQRLCDAWGLSAQVRLVGVQNDVKPYYGAADALVLPTLYDPFPNVTLEAMASGLAVITSQTCGAAEFITQGVNGYVCDALDSRRLSELLSQWRAGDRQAMAEQARRTVEPYTIEAMKDQLVALYTALLDDTGSRA